MTTLFVRESEGYREAHLREVLSAADATLGKRLRARRSLLSDTQLTREFLRCHLVGLEHEVFGLLHLDAQHRLIAHEDLFRGTLDSASIYPREVVKSVLAHNAAAVILYHNHPSGIAAPSLEDRRTTSRLREALALIEVKVLDHLIVAEGGITSFAERGLL